MSWENLFIPNAYIKDDDQPDCTSGQSDQCLCILLLGRQVFSSRSSITMCSRQCSKLTHRKPEMSCNMKKNQQSECAPSKDSDQPGHPPSLIRVFAVRMKKAWVLSYHWALSEESDQTGWMPRLIWVFAGRTLTLLVLSRGGSNKRYNTDNQESIQKVSKNKFCHVNFLLTTLHIVVHWKFCASTCTKFYQE